MIFGILVYIILEPGFVYQMFTLQVPIVIHNESEQATTWTRVYSEKTTKQSIPVITAWQLNERMYAAINLCLCFLFVVYVQYILKGWSFLPYSTSIGMGSYRALTSRRLLKDMGRRKCMSGEGVLIFLLQRVRAWKCVHRELLPILEIL